MLKHLSLIVCCFFMPLFIQAQGEANHWYFGTGAGLVFDSDTGTVTPTNAAQNSIDTVEGCATISDFNGNLLFYTDGRTVWNTNHQPMPNANYNLGTGLLGDFSSTSSGIIVPKPGNTNQYYVFTMDEPHHINAAEYPDPYTGTYPGGASTPEGDDGLNNGFNYSLVDLTLNNGLGDVDAVEKNVHLVTYDPGLENEIKYKCSEKLTATLHADGQSYWVITHFVDTFYAFKVDENGVNHTPVTTTITPTIPTTGYMVNAQGSLKISPDGNKLAIAHRQNADIDNGVIYANTGSIWLYDFDNATGAISNPVNLPNTNKNPYGLEFSPDSKKLYATMRTYGDHFLTQHDLENNYSDVLLHTQYLFGLYGLQLAPNGKIYLCNEADPSVLDVIEFPNEVGTLCNYTNAGQPVSSGTLVRWGLPTFIQSYFNIGFQANPVCEGDTTEFNSNISQPYDSLIWDFGDGNTSTDENPTHTYTNAGIYEVSLLVTEGSNTVTDTKNVTVYELPLVASVVELRQCDVDLDGFSPFNLNEVNAALSVDHENETISYYETQMDAETNANAIEDPSNYTNQVASSDIIWARVENNFGCYATAEVHLFVSTTQIPDTFIQDLYQCDDGIDTTDGVASFNFSSIQADIEALFPIGLQLQISYYTSEDDALTESNAIENTDNYQNITSPNSQNIYVRVEDSQNSDCLGLGHHITLYVEPLPMVTGPLIIEQCDLGNDGVELFDTTGIEEELSIGQPAALTFTYEDEFGNALPSPLPNPLEVTIPIYNIFATMIFEDATNSCGVETTITFTTSNSVSINAVDPFFACDNELDGQYTFDTSSLEMDLFGTPDSETEISYVDGNGSPLPSPFPNTFTTGTQTITAMISNVQNPDCFATYDVEFRVYPQPLAHTIEDDVVCDDLSNDGEHVFTLSDYNAQVLNGQSSTIFDILYFESETDALSSTDPLEDTYVVSSSLQTLFARIQNHNHPECYDITAFQLGINAVPTAYAPGPLNLCDDGNDQIETIDLTIQNDDILNGQSPTDFTISYYLSLDDAEVGVNAQSDAFTNTSNPQTVYARVENVNASGCYALTSFDIQLFEQPELLMDDLWAICEGGTVTILADEGYDLYNWSSGETTRHITVAEPGTYSITASNIYGDLICSVQKTITVNTSDIAIITDIETVDWSQSNNVIRVFVEGNGDYEYSIDGITYQDGSVFSNLAIDDYVVYVRDKNGCGIVNQDVYLLYYPRFFTPNGDGNNDVWQIKNSRREPLNKLYIYNRYGKLLIQLRPNDYGWDGTLNGRRLPSSDYWFVLERQNGKTYTGHFSLKR